MVFHNIFYGTVNEFDRKYPEIGREALSNTVNEQF